MSKAKSLPKIKMFQSRSKYEAVLKPRWKAIQRHRHLTLNSFFASLRFPVGLWQPNWMQPHPLFPAPPNHYHHQNSLKFHYIIQCYSWDSGGEAMETQHDNFHFPTESRESHRSSDKCLLSGTPNSPQVVHMHTQLESGTFHSTAAAPLSHPQKVASTKSQFFMAMPTD